MLCACGRHSARPSRRTTAAQKSSRSACLLQQIVAHSDFSLSVMLQLEIRRTLLSLKLCDLVVQSRNLRNKRQLREGCGAGALGSECRLAQNLYTTQSAVTKETKR